ncbi:hypothetical protein ACWIGW_45360 [Nocardia brasiliensis]
MREYILETARNLCHQHTDVTLDEIAATEGIDASQVHDYFRSAAELYDALLCDMG